jgi:alanine racemase
VISQIRIITAGESVDMVENLLRNLLRLTIPIGYADGISRGWGNGAGFVTIKDKKNIRECLYGYVDG